MTAFSIGLHAAALGAHLALMTTGASLNHAGFDLEIRFLGATTALLYFAITFLDASREVACLLATLHFRVNLRQVLIGILQLPTKCTTVVQTRILCSDCQCVAGTHDRLGERVTNDRSVKAKDIDAYTDTKIIFALAV